MIVYVVKWFVPYEGSGVVGIFSTKEKAEQFIKDEDDDTLYLSEWEVDGEEIDGSL